ncbi:type I-E CRISPR-associated protein Cas6/Cse3/CasE [Streptomyces sp. RFCAC02]|uniref:type I-E CRISPR-associated protein Cas6/Cse3/CasE n=1 Tax=Streptomyces sp. RFCAC02 TaxID=2499143 RepID=UPI0010222372|nr:type I-E CRISPR-associated protein Cas6/Cse3/CasE [Streptomyces sp. RFCAC02]
MFLTRFRVNTARSGGRRLISSPQVTHAAVMASFPQLVPSEGNGAPGGPRVLWRLDANAPAEVFLFIAAPYRPDLTHLVEQAGWPHAVTDGEPGWRTHPYTPFLDRITTGSTWGFRITANPVHFVRRKESEPRKRTAHRTPVHQMGWLLEQQEHAGFRITEKADGERLLPDGTTHQGRPYPGDRYHLTVRDVRPLVFRKPTATSDRNRATIVTATFDGRLEVTNADVLRRTLTQGLGKAKAYGCGLMTLAPIS